MAQIRTGMGWLRIRDRGREMGIDCAGIREARLERADSGAPGRERIMDLLKGRKIRSTPHRVAVAQALFSRPQHLTADEVLAKVNGGPRRISRPTVYNTLNLLVRRGLVRELVIDPERRIFDGNLEEHHHLYDPATGTLTDLPVSAVTLDDSVMEAHPEGCGFDVVIRLRRRAD